MVVLSLSLDFDDPFDCSVWAVATSSFGGCRRLGELVVKSLSSFDPRFNITKKGTLSTYILAASISGMRRLKFHLPWTKTTKELGADVVASAQPNRLCPCDAFKLHWNKNADVPEGFSLFGYMDKTGKPQHMTKSKFLKQVFDIWKQAGMLAVQGHSFRIGGAVELLLAGVPPHVVAAIGGWTSLAFLVYWRKLEDIIVAQVGDSYDKNWARVQKAMEDYRKESNISKQLIDNVSQGEDLTLDD